MLKKLIIAVIVIFLVQTYIYGACTSITSQPPNRTICVGANTTFAVTVTGSAPITYQWQLSTDGGTTWNNVPAAAPYTNTTSATMTITGAYITMNGYQYRCSLNGTCGNSNAGTLTIRPVVSQITTSGLLSFYPFTGNANDESGSASNHGTLQNAPSQTTDRFSNNNQAYLFNGTNQFVSTSIQYSNPSNFTISIWFNTTNAGGKLIGFGNSQTGTSGNYDRHIYMNNVGQIYFGVYPGAVRVVNSPLSYNDGNWHMATASLSSTNGIKLYIDGALVASDATTTTAQNYNGYWKIGYDNINGWTSNPSNFYFNGSLDEVYIYNRELTAGEVSTQYTSPQGASNNGPVCEGGTLGLDATTIGGASYAWTGPNSFSAATKSPSVSNMTSVKEGGYAVTVTQVGCSFTSYTLGKINPALGPGLSQVPASGLQTYLKFSGNTLDEQMLNNGTAQNGASLTTDRFNNANSAFNFDGVNDFISTTASYTNPSDFTISIWFKTTVAGGKLIGFGNSQTGTSGNYDRHLYMNNAGQIYFGVYPGAVRTLNTTASYNDGIWHMATASLSSTNGIKLYIDGSLVASSGATTTAQNYTGYWKIGYDNINGWTSNPSNYYFTGQLDDVLIYNRELTSGEVNTLYVSAVGAGSNAPVCVGVNLNLTATTVGGASYSWTGPNSFSSSAQNPSLIYTAAAAGVYTVQVTQGSCISRANALVLSRVTGGGQWQGGYSTAWTNPDNWCGALVPNSSTDVTITSPATNMPGITAAGATCRNLTIAAAASLTLSAAADLSVYGNFSNSGTYTSVAGTTIFRGATAQTITGATSFNNLTINNSNGVTLSSAVTVNGILTLTSGVLASGGNLTVNLNTGAVAGTGTGGVSGNITVIKTAASNSWHYLSPSLIGITAADLNDDVVINPYKLYYYNEAIADPDSMVGWSLITSTATPLNRMQGYALHFHVPVSIDMTGTYNHTVAPTNVTLTNTVSSKPSSDGWNLVGNPFPSTIDWDAASGWTKTGIGNAIYFWDPVNTRYATYVGGIGTNGGTRYIPSMQGFFVKVTNPGTGTLGMNNNVRVTSTNPGMWRKAREEKVLKIIAGSGSYNDETVVRFRSDATNDFDDQIDAYKLGNEGNTPTLYTMMNNTRYSVNSLPENNAEENIPIMLQVGFVGTYTFRAEILGAFGSGDSVILVDKKTGQRQDLLQNPDYIFEVEEGENGDRFYIEYKRVELVSGFPIGKEFNKGEIEVYGLGQRLEIRTGEEGNVKAEIGVYSTTGSERFYIKEVEFENGVYSIYLPSAEGIYIVKVVTKHHITNHKVYLQR
jgi:hypothetical protein